jgi:dTDP-4-dehydrorhamnose 3,5-epimerase
VLADTATSGHVFAVCSSRLSRRLPAVRSSSTSATVIFEQLSLPGLVLIKSDRRFDERGSFTRIWCAREFAEQGFDVGLSQVSLSWNRKRGTLRGMHFQAPPHQEAKVVRCVRGSVLDVVVDVRSGSATRGKWCGVELSSGNAHALYVPAGFAHGFLALEDDTELCYHISGFFEPAAARGIRWNDASIGIRWPFEPSVVSPHDMAWPDFERNPAPMSAQ